MPFSKTKIKGLTAQLEALLQDARQMEETFGAAVKIAHPAFRKSARNLLHYVALRQHDLRELQESLAQMGLSSLGRTESHVLASLQAVRRQLLYMQVAEMPKEKPGISFSESSTLLKAHTETLLGKAPAKRNARIMVTFSSELANEYGLVCRLLLAGMDCARINCAHDNATIWTQMIAQVKRAEKELNLSCKILMDLMGPKLRTGPLKPGPKLIAIHPIRDQLGQVVAPANVWLAPTETVPPFPADAALPLEIAWLRQLQEGDTLRFLDTRGRKRKMTVVKKTDTGVMAHLFKTSYIVTGTRINLKTKALPEQLTEVGEMPAIEIPIRLKKDDFLVLHKEPLPGEPALYDAAGHIAKPAHISCTLPEVFSRVEPGQPILLNDGKIEGEIAKVQEGKLLVKITGASDKGSKLRADRGINLPESNLHLNGLTEKDREDLAFVVKHADIVNLSFVNHPDTVFALQEELKKHHAGQMAIMLKIETREGFRNLPHLLLAAMRSHTAGIMIARGDLAVECGWQRLAEVQEEILWLCEAAHMPVVWATQVLETLAKKGRPSRAEITDAAMAQRADCVMLNKGPHVEQAIRLLHGILKAMQQHQHKKTSMLRTLHVSDMEQLTEVKPEII